MVKQWFRCADRLIFYALFVLIVGLTPLACQLSSPAEPTGTPEVAVTATMSFPATETLAPSPTPASPLVILWAASGSDAQQTATMQTVLAELSAQQGLRFEIRPDIQVGDLDEGARLVVVIPPDPGLAALAAANPSVQFLAVGISNAQLSQNVSTIAAQGERPDRQGFLAGYLAAVITQDWRVGVISLSDSASGQAASLGFTKGVIFYCGLCRPVYPPFLQYPISVELPAVASQAEQQAAADTLIANAVTTVYVFPGAGDATLLAYLAQAGVNVIGSGTPPADAQDHWVASIRADWVSAVQLIWPQLMNGQGGINQDGLLSLTDCNDSLFSPGRQHFVEQILADLSAGYIDTGIDPLTGRER